MQTTPDHTAGLCSMSKVENETNLGKNGGGLLRAARLRRLLWLRRLPLFHGRGRRVDLDDAGAWRDIGRPRPPALRPVRAPDLLVGRSGSGAVRPDGKGGIFARVFPPPRHPFRPGVGFSSVMESGDGEDRVLQRQKQGKTKVGVELM